MMMELPDNWKKLPNSTLFLKYQRVAFRQGDMKTVRLIGDEMRDRLEQKGYVNTYPFGWMKVDDITQGLERNVIHEEDSVFYVVGRKKTKTFDKKIKGRVTKSEKEIIDTSGFNHWFNGIREREKREQRREKALEEQVKGMEKLDLT